MSPWAIQDSLEDSPRTTRVLALPSTRRDLPKKSNQTGSSEWSSYLPCIFCKTAVEIRRPFRNKIVALTFCWIFLGLLREELEKVSKQLAEQRALVATLEVEITTVLQEKKIQELDYKSHIQQYVILIIIVCLQIKLYMAFSRYNKIVPRILESENFKRTNFEMKSRWDPLH